MSDNLAVILVTWNVCDLVLDALRTLYDDLAGSGLAAMVYVVDSASSDDTVKAVRSTFPQAQMIASNENLGFGRANNLAMRQIGFGNGAKKPEQLPRAVYLLNPDTLTKPGATRALFDALFADESVGLAGANLTYGDGSFQHGAFMFPGLRQIYAEFFPLPGRLIEGVFNGRYSRTLYEGIEPFAVDFTLGATMMLKREVILETGMFDEDFFMYCEEVDWGWRIHNAGWKAICVPQAHVVHLGGQSTAQVNARSVVYLWESRLRLYRKHYPTWKFHLARWMVRLGMLRKLRRLAFDRKIDTTARTQLEAAYQSVVEMTYIS